MDHATGRGCGAGRGNDPSWWRFVAAGAGSYGARSVQLLGMLKLVLVGEPAEEHPRIDDVRVGHGRRLAAGIVPRRSRSPRSCEPGRPPRWPQLASCARRHGSTRGPAQAAPRATGPPGGGAHPAWRSYHECTTTAGDAGRGERHPVHPWMEISPCTTGVSTVQAPLPAGLTKRDDIGIKFSGYACGIR